MKIRILFFLLIGFLFASCATPIPNIPIQTPMSTPSVARTPRQTLTPTPTIPTSTPTKYLTVVPTLPVEDARQRLLDLLATNGGCHLPCLWGITPGKSTNQDARNILIPLSSIAEVASFGPLYGILGGGITPQYIDGELRLNSEIDYFYGEDDIVTSLLPGSGRAGGNRPERPRREILA